MVIFWEVDFLSTRLFPLISSTNNTTTASLLVKLVFENDEKYMVVGYLAKYLYTTWQKQSKAWRLDRVWLTK